MAETSRHGKTGGFPWMCCPGERMTRPDSVETSVRNGDGLFVTVLQHITSPLLATETPELPKLDNYA